MQYRVYRFGQHGRAHGIESGQGWPQPDGVRPGAGRRQAADRRRRARRRVRVRSRQGRGGGDFAARS
ncbi:hypothetical protein G6F65_020598 [Rhizopus arrhizus]|nr:hypothetical protein G6F65_020598 [Rhizopus arrhizus]